MMQKKYTSSLIFHINKDKSKLTDGAKLLEEHLYGRIYDLQVIYRCAGIALAALENND